jgi:exonuclease SbcC
VIDGQTFDRLKGAGSPEPLSKVLRLPLVSAGNIQSFDIHFGQQKSPIFLLNESGSCAASFFASSSDAIRLVEMQKLHRTKTAGAQRDKDRLERESKQLNDELETLRPISEIDQALRGVEDEYSRLIQLVTTIGEIAYTEEAIRRELDAFEYCENKASALGTLTAAPLLAATEPLAVLCSALTSVAQTQAHWSGVSGSLVQLSNAPKMDDTGRLATLCGEIRRAEEDRIKKSLRYDPMASLISPPSLADEKPYFATFIGGRKALGDQVCGAW